MRKLSGWTVGALCVAGICAGVAFWVYMAGTREAGRGLEERDRTSDLGALSRDGRGQHRDLVAGP